MKGRFNVFQSAMLRWRALYPYNAVHVLVVPAALERARLAAVIDEVLEGSGLTGFRLDARARRYEYEGGPAATVVDILHGGDDPLEVVRAEIEARINHAFPADGRYQPFRFFAVRIDGGFHLGVGYDHPLAGGDSIVLLLTDIADRYAATVGNPAVPTPPHVEAAAAHTALAASHVAVAASPAACAVAPIAPLDRYPPTYTRLFAVQWRALLAGLSRLPAIVSSGRSSVRPRLSNPADGTNGFVQFAIAGQRFQRLRTAARAWGMSVNDLMLAVILQAVASLAPDRHRQPRRRLAAIASIVNLRSDFAPPAEHTFGQFLSSVRIAHAVPDGLPLATLALDVHAQSLAARKRKLYLQTLLVMGVSALGWRFLGDQRRRRFYFKYHPILAGVTPLNVNALRRSGPCSDGVYLRAASTGPLSPMVFATTLSGAAIQVGITFRRSAVTRQQVENLVESVCRCIESME
jgi:hypothetical protein